MIATNWQVIQAIGWALVHFVWQGAVIGVVTAMLLWTLRREKPQSRYALACGALLLCVGIFFYEFFQRLQIKPVELISLSEYLTTSSPIITQDSVMQLHAWLQKNLHWFVLWWALVVALLNLRLSLGLLWLRGYQHGRRGDKNDFWQNKVDLVVQQFGLNNRVVLRVVQDIESPMTIGFFRPMILIPASLLTGMSPDLLEALIAHEVAHISRFDYAINLIQHLIEMVLFFHPAVWWISKKIRIERENIADDLAARTLDEPRRLALALQELDRFQFATPQLAQAAHGGNLMSRIKRLIRPEVGGDHLKTAVIVFIFSGIFFCSLFYYFGSNSKAPTNIHGSEKLGSNVSNVENKVIASKDGIIPARIDFSTEGCRPEYPRASLRNEESGTTSLSVITDIDGKISNVEVTKSSGFKGLDEAVVGQLLSGSCINKPGTKDGVPFPTTTRVQYFWSLD